MEKALKNTWLSVFILIVIGELLACLSIFPEIYFKPLLLIWIGLYFHLNVQKLTAKVSLWLYAAFFFSWLGDVLLMFQQQNSLFFIAGLGSFLVAQVSYSITFWKLGKRSELLKKKPYLFLPYLIYGTGLCYLLYPQLDVVLKIAVPLYAATLLLMSVTALNRKPLVQGTSFWQVFIGSLLFIFSDSSIAINKFMSPIPYSGLVIMSTYIAAQFLIMNGLLVEYRKGKV